MSKISQFYNGLLDELVAIFPNKTRIIDPYNLENNPSHILRDAWGVKKNGMTPGVGEICFHNETHRFSIVLSKEVVRTEEETTLFDTAYLAIEEDMVTLRQSLYDVDQIGVPSSVRSIDLEDASGLEVNYFEKGIFLSMECNFSVQITEEI